MLYVNLHARLVNHKNNAYHAFHLISSMTWNSHVFWFVHPLIITLLGLKHARLVTLLAAHVLIKQHALVAQSAFITR